MLCILRSFSAHHSYAHHSGYLSYCILSVILTQPGHSLLTSFLKKVFQTMKVPLTGFFVPKKNKKKKLGTVECENPRRSAVIEILKPQLSKSPRLCCEHYLKLLTLICMVLHIAVLPHDWLIKELHKCVGVQLVLLKCMVSVCEVYEVHATLPRC